MLVGVALAVAAGIFALPASAATSVSVDPEDLSGTWSHDMMAGNLPARAKATDENFTLTDGTVIPLLPAAKELYRQRVAQAQTDHPFANTSSRCLPIGTPGNMMGAPYPIQIVQGRKFIGMLFEEGGQFRSIFMNGKHPEEIIPSFMGHSIGHWEGRTLVVDTVGMRADTTLNFTGLPHSTSLHVVERISRLAPDKLVDLIEITDPLTYSKSFTFKSIFSRSDEELIEYICENDTIHVTPDGRQTYDSAK
jgi:hypothetical protein